MADTKSSALITAKQENGPHKPKADPDEQFNDRPYLCSLQTLEHAFPYLKSFLQKLKNDDRGRKLVRDHYREKHDRVPGRCYCLQFEDKKVAILNEYPMGFKSPEDLKKYLEKNPAQSSRESKKRRLFILEDLELDYVDTLGYYLGVDPSVFSEQMNTWNFTDSGSVPCRALPSVSSPAQSFTLRYYEIRTLADHKSVDTLMLQMTFAINRRKYERWRDIDLPSAGTKDKRHAFIRRCASFWTSQEPGTTDVGWDALLLVDPGMSAGCVAPDTDYILQDPVKYPDRATLWNAHDWNTEEQVKAVEHKSKSYHDGCPTLARLSFSNPTSVTEAQKFKAKRDLTSPLDEMVFYWTHVAPKNLIEEAKSKSSNASYYLLKHIAQHWIHQLELINCTVAKGEYLSDDYQATIDDNLSQHQWKADLIKVNDITKDINYMRRQMNHFWRAIVMNLERLGIQLGCEAVDESASLAINGAQKDFLTINYRMQPLRERAEALTAIANDLANLRAAFRGVHDSEFGLRLSLFASIVFPLTMVAAILSMGDDFLPGKGKFWIFWATSLPATALFALVLVYGRRPYRIFKDIKEYVGIRRERGGKKNSEKQKDRMVDGKKKDAGCLSLC